MDKNDIINYVMHTPHNTNKAVLSDMLNQLTEGGGGTEPLIVTDTNGTLDKTWNEIHNAMLSGSQVIVNLTYNEQQTHSALVVDTLSFFLGVSLTVQIWTGDQITPLNYAAQSADGYPAR